MGVVNIIVGAGELLFMFFEIYFSCSFCLVLVGLSVYSPSMRSWWMGVLVLFQQPWFPLSVMFLVVGCACVEIGTCSVEVLEYY
jgi:hypothetical protein